MLNLNLPDNGHLALLPLIFVSFGGTYLSDLIINHNVLFNNNPDPIKYELVAKALPNLIFILMSYIIFSRYYDTTTAWVIGVPVGIVLHMLYITAYTYFNPIDNVTTKGLPFKESHGLGFTTNFFNYMFFWIIATVVLFIQSNRGVGNDDWLKQWLLVILGGIILFFVIYPNTSGRFKALDSLPMKPNCNVLDPRNCRDISIEEAKRLIS